jgi:pimeloyl-ACP methyl ester carboxylesterase
LSATIERETGDAAVNGTRIHYECAGSGAPVVFIHAGVADLRMWDPQVEVFARKYRVIRYDLRGFGQSPMPEGPYANGDDLYGLLEHLGIAKAALIGCSMGGAAAFDFVLEHPAMVTALVAVGSGVNGYVPTDMTQEAAHWGAFIGAIQKGEIGRARELDASLWIDGIGRDASQIDPAYRKRARELHRDNFKPERLLHPETQHKPPAIERLGEIAAPLLVMVGDRDEPNLLKLANRLKSEVKGARLEVIRNAAHLPSLEHPAEFNRIVLEFLASSLG